MWRVFPLLQGSVCLQMNRGVRFNQLLRTWLGDPKTPGLSGPLKCCIREDLAFRAQSHVLPQLLAREQC
jgi:hypothetical protein